MNVPGHIAQLLRKLEDENCEKAMANRPTPTVLASMEQVRLLGNILDHSLRIIARGDSDEDLEEAFLNALKNWEFHMATVKNWLEIKAIGRERSNLFERTSDGQYITRIRGRQ